MKRLNVKDFMKKSGIPMHLKGYEVLTLCIESHVENPDKTIGDIYSEVYEKAKCTHWSVERNIRTAIKVGMPNMDKKFKNTLFPHVEIPKSGEYIKTVSYAIRNNLI